MNIRKPVDYGTMYRELTAILTQNLPQMDEVYAIGKGISQRPEKGAAVAAAEYLQANFPDRVGFSPRNVRRMRDFYKTYDDTYKMGLGKIFTFTLKDGESTDADTCTVAVKGFISESDTSGFDVELQYVDGAWKFVKYSNAWNQHQFFTPEPENSDGPEKG